VRKPKYQTKVVLEDSTRKQIEARAKANGRSTAEEIRRRLEWTFDIEQDAITHKLVSAIPEVARSIKVVFGRDWHSDQYVTPAMEEAIAYLINSLATMVPPDEDTRQPSHADYNVDKKGAGRTVAQMALYKLEHKS
jgi:hypothetical protein